MLTLAALSSGHTPRSSLPVSQHFNKHQAKHGRHRTWGFDHQTRTLLTRKQYWTINRPTTAKQILFVSEKKPNHDKSRSLQVLMHVLTIRLNGEVCDNKFGVEDILACVFCCCPLSVYHTLLQQRTPRGKKGRTALSTQYHRIVDWANWRRQSGWGLKFSLPCQSNVWNSYPHSWVMYQFWGWVIWMKICVFLPVCPRLCWNGNEHTPVCLSILFPCFLWNAHSLVSPSIHTLHFSSCISIFA